jgi:hypothetical protein
MEKLMTDFETRVAADLKVLRSQMDQLMGVGQPGRLHHIEQRISASEQGVQRMKGVIGAFGAILTLLHLAINAITGKHI